MPQLHDHLERARQNEKLAEWFSRASDATCMDWAVALLFYSALHFIDAFLAGKNCHPLTHHERNEEIERNGSLSEIHRDYMALQKMSENARYDISRYDKSGFNRAMDRFLRIKNHVLRKMP